MFERYRDTWLEINLANIYDNYLTIQTKLKGKQAIPVVKADAYGHGAIEVVRYLRYKGVRFFAVSLLEEALELRKEFNDIDLLVMGVIDKSQLSVVSKHNIIFTFSDMKIADDVIRFPGSLRFHVKFDSGMNRLGIKEESDIISLFKQLHSIPDKQPEGIYTHFATSDSNESFHHHQLEKFRQLLGKLPAIPASIHASNTSSVLRYEDEMPENTHARVGISLYGLSSEANIDYLKTTFVLKTKISQIKHLEKDDYVGYGITYQAKEKETIGIIPIGYADGFIRQNKHGLVQINHKTYPLVGNICMDQSFIKIDNTISEEDTVILIGGDMVTTDDVAHRLKTINYEILCTITQRVPRVYIK